MSVDLQPYRVTTFPNINDVPVVPTASSPGNGSHLIKVHNDLVNVVENEINNIQDNLEGIYNNLSVNWIVVDDSYAASPGQKIVVNINNDSPVRSSYELVLPSSVPIGTHITYVGTNTGATIDIVNFNILNSNSYYTRVFTRDAFIVRTLIYIGTQKGWCTVTGMNYQTTVQAN